MRNRVAAAIAVISFVYALTFGQSQPTDSPPTASMLQAGDLVWPKRPGAFVPYTSRTGEETNEDRREWERERDREIERLKKLPNPSIEERGRYSLLTGLTFAQFKNVYLADADSGAIVPMGTSSFYVGHVGIIQLVNGVPHVIEAVLGKGVVRTKYTDWLNARRSELVWLGRVKTASQEARASIAERASQQLGKPYRFWNFDLTDTSGFYCSKLAWWAITSATGVFPDDNRNPNRALWYSPKRLMRSPHIEILHNPGNYAIR